MISFWRLRSSVAFNRSSLSFFNNIIESFELCDESVSSLSELLDSVSCFRRFLCFDDDFPRFSFFDEAEELSERLLDVFFLYCFFSASLQSELFLDTCLLLVLLCEVLQ